MDEDTAGGDGRDSALGHPGELEMRRRYPGQYRWDEDTLSAMMRPLLSPSLIRFVEAQPFFFIATAGPSGHCDASFRGREYDASGRPLPAVKVIEPTRLMFPDFDGNGLYNSLGNILENPHIGMLFMDFDRQRRARVNGRAAVRTADPAALEVWPLARRVVEVTVEQAFGNCNARIPRLVMEPGSDR